jgi:hypothetical protein
LDGEGGADTFRFESIVESPYSARDTIIAFSGVAGDRIDFSAVDSNTLVSGNQVFTFIGSDLFTAAGQLRLSNGILSADANGDHMADFGVVIGSAHLDPDYFIL